MQYSVLLPLIFYLIFSYLWKLSLYTWFQVITEVNFVWAAYLRNFLFNMFHFQVKSWNVKVPGSPFLLISPGWKLCPKPKTSWSAHELLFSSIRGWGIGSVLQCLCSYVYVNITYFPWYQICIPVVSVDQRIKTINICDLWNDKLF